MPELWQPGCFMLTEHKPKIHLAQNASGAHFAALKGHLVVIVDVIDFSTSLETAIEKGALAVFGASPDNARVPVAVKPESVAVAAAKCALEHNAGIVLISEPRQGEKSELIDSCLRLYNTLKSLGVTVDEVIPNVGKGVSGLADFMGKVVVGVTKSGGTAFDAAFSAGAKVISATIARTADKKAIEPALAGCLRALKLAKKNQKDISFVAASSNSLVDILACQYLYNLIRTL